MRMINTKIIGEIVYEKLIEINFKLPVDIKDKIDKSINEEDSVRAKSILDKIKKNYIIAEDKSIPLCQDTGMVVIFLEIGQNVYFEGEYIEDVINSNVAKAYKDAYLRKSIVENPIYRINTKDNTPAVVYYEIVKGDKVKISISSKGFGSENMSRIAMLNPTDGIEAIKKFVIETVIIAGPNPCPPIVVGVGIGGTMEKAAILSKKALLRNLEDKNKDEKIKKIEDELLDEINKLNIGPMGMGGKITAFSVNIETYATHIAGLPVSVNINCHCSRHIEVVI